MLISFFAGFLVTWFVLKYEQFHPKKICSMKNTIVKLATNCNYKKLVKGLRNFSYLQIQHGHYEYGEVLEKLSRKK